MSAGWCVYVCLSLLGWCQTCWLPEARRNTWPAGASCTARCAVAAALLLQRQRRVGAPSRLLPALPLPTPSHPCSMFVACAVERCVIQVKILNETESGEHKFKVTGKLGELRPR